MNKRLQCHFCFLLKFSIIILLFYTEATSQSGIISSGGNVSNASGSVSYSAGQVFYLSHNTEYGTVLEGLQQPYEIFTVDIPGVSANMEITLFPNPASTHLMIKAVDFQNEKLCYQLFNLYGQLLDMKDITEEETIIQVQHLEPSSYIIHVLQDDKPLKSFTLIKHSR